MVLQKIHALYEKNPVFRKKLSVMGVKSLKLEREPVRKLLGPEFLQEMHAQVANPAAAEFLKKYLVRPTDLGYDPVHGSSVENFGYYYQFTPMPSNPKELVIRLYQHKPKR